MAEPTITAWIADDEQGPYIVGVMLNGMPIPLVGMGYRSAAKLKEVGMGVNWEEHKNFRFATFTLVSSMLAEEVRRELINAQRGSSVGASEATPEGRKDLGIGDTGDPPIHH